jgi:DNA-binding protein
MAKKKTHFAWSPVRKLMKSVGAQIVARDAVELLIADLEETAKKLTKKALGFAKHAKRKKVSKDDMDLAIKYL